jgi:hypothetical protein
MKGKMKECVGSYYGKFSCAQKSKHLLGNQRNEQTRTYGQHFQVYSPIRPYSWVE